ncbi:heme-dependent catalase [Meira miltonrushii]|uniref:Heme-dependent catalase n=1 Tax=Meira miltonrushii TaxID=1280837 RepID=A0A316V6T1_9BASI|nr:heme-dependent catalase [Meira miltonrushii]PWN31903.1 heme-dependent catalase [Meira miltonrushii]
MSPNYIRWDQPGVEHGAGPEEEAAIDECCKLINESQRRVFNEHQHAFTGTHVKTHGVVKGNFEVLPNLPEHLAQSFFAKPGSHPVALRFSTETTDLVPDHLPQPRGIGMKVFDVDGEKLREGMPNHKTHDFEFNSAPAIELGNAFICRDILNLRLKYTDPKEHQRELKKRDDYECQDARNHLPTTPLLSQKQYSQSAYRYGDYVAKFAIVPSKNAPQLTKTNQDNITEKDDGAVAYRDRMVKYMKEEKGETQFDFQVQLLQNLDDQLIEDCRTAWPEDKYPFETVAKITIPPQDPFLPERINLWRNNIRINPWDGRKDLKPLGSINRLRIKVYYASAVFRRKMNGNVPEVNVQHIDELPDK